MMREYANKQLVMMGLKKPETPEEMEMVQQAQQQPQQPSAEQIQAQGILLPIRVRLNCSGREPTGADSG